MDIDYFKENFEPEITRRFENREFPGMAISIIEDGAIIYSFGLGFRDIKNFKDFNADTLARFGSCSKSFTSLAILLLENQGKLSVDDPITDYLPITTSTGTDAITIHHLMTHTSGLPDIFIDRMGYTRDEYLERVTNIIKDSRADLGRFIYSNIGYSLLAMIVEKASRKSFDEAMRGLILTPLNMKRTIMLGDEELASIDDNHSIPYMPKKDEYGNLTFTKSEYRFEEFTKGPGGIVTSCNEMLIYLDMLMNNGSVGGKIVFKPSVIAKKLSRYLKDENLTKMLKTDSFEGYGIGIKDGYKGQTFMNTAGGIVGGISLIGFYKEAKIGFACIGNSEGFPLMFIYDVWDKILDNDPVFKNWNK
ncbi:MAG: serine hydrolase domain-containing protein [Candidatus Heimdallarchaeota archaeon]